MDIRLLPQPGGRQFGGQVPLYLAEHLKADDKLAHRGRAEERGVEVGVELPGR